MDGYGLIAIILICGLFADNMLIKGKLKNMGDRIKDLEKKLHDK
jgi:hypothetical protein